ncbi:hypothetical protein HETIRDRAFT_307693 [Heterobasidion irregulare TC 32-1]|uniref:Alkyl hydroperoxide reductase subunit C/ Thiol specific antioxidant domain-containing protein n=1 Tax=Heterobasidion irregulare (strain TC 32-1) TaxID=747525 RepID=W4KL58_HETIT|nr:uncharacterized protein HETIRDRAFT_307693 [Heterobasidion irregulare TC 32-1]ETW86562.1 hypothetical protein HETIRDRAFT_307693 [Heterobasidion irregulare TC 32-1]
MPGIEQTGSLIEANVIEEASNLEIFDVKGAQVRFGSIFENEKAVVVFIRHFFCGQYVSQLASVRQDALKDAGVKIVVVGCGEWKLIDNYKETTSFQGDIYADPTRKLYHALGMTIETLNQTPAGQEKRSYLQDGLFTNVLKSIKRGPLKNPMHIGKQGNLSQLGGEFVFGPGSQCVFSSRMQHTEDHVEVTDLMKEVGVAFP